MTSNDATPTIPAGWYPDHEGGPRLRWWDGGQWTEHVSEPTVPAYTTVAPVPRAVPVETPAGNVYIWLIVLLPIVSVLLELTINYSAMMAASITDPLAIYRDPGYIATVLFGLFLYAATVVLAYFDWKRLKTTGFDRPFHWGFAFIGTIVYLIGRTVIVYRRSHRGLAPLWAYIGVIVLSIIVSVIEVSSIVGTVMQNVPNLPTNA